MSNQHQGYLSVPKSTTSNGYNNTVGSRAGGSSSPNSGTSNVSNRAGGDIEHRALLAEHLKKLCFNEEYSDVTFVVEGQKLPAHKVVLAARSDYFRALLYGGMKESTQTEIELDAPLDAFKALLNYVYTGHMSVSGMKQDTVLDALGLAHAYNFVDLENAISFHLRHTLSLSNVCAILDAARLYRLNSLIRVCHRFMDRHAVQILKMDSIYNLSQGALAELLARDSFCAPEVDIFHAVCNWIKANQYAENCTSSSLESPLSSVRLTLMSVAELLTVVRPVGLMSADALLDAIGERTRARYNSLPHRGLMLLEENVACPRHGATVIAGELREALLSGETEKYDMERGYTRHAIGEPSPATAGGGTTDPGGIIVQLGSPCIINHIKLLLWDRDLRSYSYYIEVSMDQKDWIRVINYSKEFCRSWQHLYFTPKVVHYIRIVGTNNTVNKVFHVVSMEAMYTSRMPTLIKGYVVPQYNVATLELSATVIEGVSRSRNALLNGDTQHYDWDSGYTCHQLGSGAILVQLGQPYMISSIRLLLWDCDERAYSYYVETSVNLWNWELVADRTRVPCRSWQTIRFSARPVVFIRIVGTHNTANEVFHCVHLECPAQESNAANTGDGDVVDGDEIEPSTSHGPVEGKEGNISDDDSVGSYEDKVESTSEIAKNDETDELMQDNDANPDTLDKE
ncbi:BTB/POZ domain-containing protein 9 [Chrysoperla carnea]|uniref:BTB/POZ domain-containing protein 9 n=1 Tax=Chrysoperla carnea TaxID=189513 RepID=UPI001D0983A6|nr:BTB/POZ domain-containing protein 9 [Chrysoperla carnea]XP_044738079.1 BTB/POZ domain-containing protein 9 [Chrysoperla carnea]